MENFAPASLELCLSKSPTIEEILTIESDRAEGKFFLAHGWTQQRVKSLTADGKLIVVHLEDGKSRRMWPESVVQQLWKVDSAWKPEKFATKDTQLVGTAGVYYVLAQLAFRGFHAAATHGNAPHLDILVSSPDGAATLAIQVKTTAWALRTRGRGGDKAPFELQFPLGHKAANIKSEGMFFAFVELKNFADGGMPDVYIVPSVFVYNRCNEWASNAKMVRFHVKIADMKPFKNGWHLLIEALMSNSAA